MVRLVMLVALLVANLADAPGISWINYAILVYDIISAAIARFAGLTKRSLHYRLLILWRNKDMSL